ncbi:hypothetical protein BOO69_09935 [Sulfitobacter alexandrii]|uniref:Uncharacterized protein n=1 Tax=Sulfitobacter alexandrii TaxID=1917485 RepID=A0A1J0WHB9_9RHOB|nr:hypothetical protein [Sulfitobacter alexandrii]APE43698.1 hypothetical protein BOO69_09935 [Sulfitobacter alexandrii]
MKHLMLLPALLLAPPALAHPGLHVAPHGAEWMPVFMGLALIVAAGAVALHGRVRARGRGRR